MQSGEITRYRNHLRSIKSCQIVVQTRLQICGKRRETKGKCARKAQTKLAQHNPATLILAREMAREMALDICAILRA